ncbi:MAG: hypothetical protein EHM64_04655 [Ignavibacteriae bacterium]|nr:MAG: hypothetical protein EHM64_04655 [Ignavibacteriota bacterium]
MLSTMPPINEIRSTVNTVLQSKDFKDSPVYSKLLSYLIESTVSKKIPKEITIAIDIFGKESGFNSNKDSTVRHHILVLRNKLDNYYKNEGKDDKFRLVIPKGHYEIQFLPANNHHSKLTARLTVLSKYWQSGLIFILSFIILYFIYLQTNGTLLSSIPHTSFFIDSKDKIWNSFFENGYPVTIVLGDDFWMDEYSPEFKRFRQVRDWKISSENDLANLLKKYPNANLVKSEITGIPFGATDNLMDILHIVYHFQDNVSLTMSSTLSLEKVRDNNIIYIGEFRNLRILDKIFYKTPIRYQYAPDERLFIVDEHGRTVNTFLRIEAPYEQQNKYNVDYSLLIKMPGFSKENYMFIVGFGYGGRLERTKMLANAPLRAKFIEEISKTHKSVPEYFIALFEVKSIERTGFTNELKYFKEISGDFFLEGPDSSQSAVQ